MIIMKKIVGLLLVLSASSNVLTANYNDSIVTMGLAFNAVFFAGYAVYTTPNDVSIPIGIGAGLGALLTSYMALANFFKKYNFDRLTNRVFSQEKKDANEKANETSDANEAIDAGIVFRHIDFIQNKADDWSRKEFLKTEILFGGSSLILSALSIAIMIKNNNYYIAPAALFSSFALARIL